MSERLTKRQKESSSGAAKLVGIKLPPALVADLDRAVELTDSDRSKFTRIALRERIAKVNKEGAR